MRIFIILIFIFIGISGFSQSFTTQSISSSAFPTSVVFGDFDLDGKKDFIMNSGGNVVFFEPLDIVNNQWYQKEIFKENGQIKSDMIPADIDNDGDTDMIMVYKKNLSLFENKSTAGTLSFAFKNLGVPFEGFVYLDGYDHDGDGDLDIAASTSNGDIKYIRNDGANTFTSVNVISLSSTVNKIEFTDLDGKPGGEIVIATISTNNPLVYLYQNGSTWAKQTLDGDANADYSAFDIEDFNNDGRPDIIAYNGYKDKPFLYLNKGGNPVTFQVKEIADVRTFTTGSVMYTVDINKDGLMDFVSGVEGSFGSDYKTYLYINTGSTSDPAFTQEVFSDVASPNDLYESDFDNDGDNDYLYCLAFGGLFWVENDFMVGIDDEVSSSPLKLYPNPVNTSLSFSQKEYLGQPYSITNMAGKEILKGKLTEQIDVSQLDNGQYIFTIKNKNCAVNFQKI